MIRLIAAIDRNRGIGKCGCIPWKIPGDERYFTDQTKKYGGITLTGRVTYDMFSGPLKDRRNFVLTRMRELILGVEVINDLEDFLQSPIVKEQDLWVVGGASVFDQTIGRADELYLTPIDAAFGCDRFFPEYENEFELSSKTEVQEENGFNYHYEVWRLKR